VIYVCIIISIVVWLIIKFILFRMAIRKSALWVKSYKARNPGYIYFFRGSHEPFYKIKIGRTNNPLSRLRSHRTANPHGIEVLLVFQTRSDVKAEQFLHKYFATSRISPRNEWFYWSFDMWLVMTALRDDKLTRRVRSWL